jgi:hypothetical protein
MIVMDWARVIERNSRVLKAIVAALFAMLGSAAVARIPRDLHRAVLRVLNPAEAATRRLIVIAARCVVVNPARPRAKPQAPIKRGKGKRPPAFRLFDPRKRFPSFDRQPGRHPAPRVWSAGPADPTVAALWARQRSLAPKPPDDGLIDGSRLHRRLEALKLALADVPRQARRLVRARARRAKVARLQLQSVMGPGRPPGYRKRPLHEVDHVLAECHWPARDVEAHDTS